MVKAVLGAGSAMVAALLGGLLLAWTAPALDLLPDQPGEQARQLVAHVHALQRAHPMLVGAGLAVLLLGLLGRGARGLGRRSGPRDPRRMFTAEERRAGFARAGHRCELDVWLGLRRCPSPAQHADHWWPHTHGGASTMANLVAACVRHNTRKGSRLPTLSQTRRLARRRRGYFPAGEPTRPGDRYRAAGATR